MIEENTFKLLNLRKLVLNLVEKPNAKICS